MGDKHPTTPINLFLCPNLCAIWVCSSLHTWQHLIAHSLRLTRTCDFLWPIERRRCNIGRVPSLASRGFAWFCSFSWNLASMVWITLDFPAECWEVMWKKAKAHQLSDNVPLKQFMNELSQPSHVRTTPLTARILSTSQLSQSLKVLFLYSNEKLIVRPFKKSFTHSYETQAETAK